MAKMNDLKWPPPQAKEKSGASSSVPELILELKALGERMEFLGRQLADSGGALASAQEAFREMKPLGGRMELLGEQLADSGSAIVTAAGTLLRKFPRLAVPAKKIPTGRKPRAVAKQTGVAPRIRRPVES